MLPKVPKGRELEDFVAAYFQSTRHFVEKSIEEKNVLELDVVVTDYSNGNADSSLLEVKGGKEVRFTDLFKVLGWMKYLGIPSARFVATSPPKGKDVAFVNEKFEPMGARLVVLSDLSDVVSCCEDLGDLELDETLHEMWRFSFWIERRYIQVLHDGVHKNAHSTGTQAALDYYKLVNSGVFLSRTPIERVQRLYEAYKEHPRLACGVAAEIDGSPFDPFFADSDTPAFRSALYNGSHPLVQATMYVEQRARLAILKAAVDYLLEAGTPTTKVTLEQKSYLKSAGLPASFIDALVQMAKSPQYWMYPIVWQVFLWGWGGLILDDLREDDTEAILDETGLDEDALEDALAAFDLMFPLDGGWFRHLPNASRRFVIMVPWAFQGIGAFRRLVRADTSNYSDLGLTGQFAVHDLAVRHNNGVALLKKA